MPRLWPLALAALLLPALQASAQSSGDNAREWLQRVSTAANTLDYDGIFVYHSGDWMETMRLIHRTGPKGTQARLIALSGAAREVIRDDNQVTCILPDTDSVLVSKSLHPAVAAFSVFSPNGDFSGHYKLQAAPGNRVAGRETEMVSIMPKDQFRYGYRLSVDRKSGFLLKSELLDHNGKVLEKIVYTSLELPKTIPDSLLKPGISGAGYSWYVSEAPTKSAGGSSWAVEWVPEGFEMADSSTDPAGFGRMPVEHLVYNDGLTSVSVFIEKLKPGNKPLDGLSSMGAVNAFGFMIDGYQVTAVGEVPGVTVERVGRSVHRR